MQKQQNKTYIKNNSAKQKMKTIQGDERNHQTNKGCELIKMLYSIVYPLNWRATKNRKRG